VFNICYFISTEPTQIGPGAHTPSCINDYGVSFPEIKRPGVVLTTSQYLAPRLKKE